MEIENLQSEKVALDRQLVRKIQECLALETACVKLEKMIEDLKRENSSLKDQVEKPVKSPDDFTVIQESSAAASNCA